MKKFLNVFHKSKRKVIEYIISNRLFLSYVILSVIGTFLVRHLTLGRVTTLFPFFTDLGIILLVGGIGYIIRAKNQFKYFFTWICIFTLIEIVNSIYYVFYTSFASFGELSSLSQAETVTGSIFEKLSLSYFIYLIFPAIFYLVHKKLNASAYYNFIGKVEKGKIMCLITLAAGFGLLSFSFAKAERQDYSRLAKLWNRNFIVERWGILMYEANDLFQTLRPRLSSLFGLEEAQELFNEYFGAEDRNEYKSENKYTGILEGKNIVFVHMESMQSFLMDLVFNGVELTPNLNKLAKEGMFFSNFYPQVSTGTSSDTEFTLLSSLMPAASGPVFTSYYDRNYNTIPKYLTEMGYYTYSMHGNLSSMWNRNKAHPSLGYQGMYFEETFEYGEEDVINLGINDKLFYKQAVPVLEQIERSYPNYMGTIITLSNHSPFTFIEQYGEFDFSVTYQELNQETGIVETKISNYLEGTAVGNYMNSVHYADEALGDFIQYIKSSDYFDNTIFVFYGDHDAKLTRKELNYLFNYDYRTGKLYDEEDEHYVTYDSFAHDLNKKTPLIIWTKNDKLKYTFRGEIDYYMGMIDVAPTILNMFGLSNDYALGHDIFNIRDNNVIAFPNGNFITNMMYYNNSTGDYKIINENIIIDENYIENRKKDVENLLDVSNAIIVYNLLDAKEKFDE
ncbi:MAG: LTA synthase family protein [Firmicutes bacterium]|nr:LTA synthase family protein [Bacillota bacterium]